MLSVANDKSLISGKISVQEASNILERAKSNIASNIVELQRLNQIFPNPAFSAEDRQPTVEDFKNLPREKIDLFRLGGINVSMPQTETVSQIVNIVVKQSKAFSLWQMSKNLKEDFEKNIFNKLNTLNNKDQSTNKKEVEACKEFFIESFEKLQTLHDLIIEKHTKLSTKNSDVLENYSTEIKNLNAALLISYQIGEQLEICCSGLVFLSSLLASSDVDNQLFREHVSSQQEETNLAEHVKNLVLELNRLREEQRKENPNILEQAKKAPVENFPTLQVLLTEKAESVETKFPNPENLSPRHVHFVGVPDNLSSSSPSTTTTTQSQANYSFLKHLFSRDVDSSLKPGASVDSETSLSVASKNPTVKGSNPVENLSLAELKKNLKKVSETRLSEERTEEKPQKARAATLDQSSSSMFYQQPKVTPKLSPDDKTKKQARSLPDLNVGYKK
jgi:hypothetical protein